MINKELINQEFLADEIKSLEKWYVETLINLIKWPIFIESCKNGIEIADEARKEALEKALKSHLANQDANEEAVEQLNKIITEAKTYIIN
jgi:hypothetical protein